ncbi:MAG: hypothetical protein AAF556_08240, partial [Pseudomonadota bacterium]
MIISVFRRLAVALPVLMLAACSTPHMLVNTPNIYALTDQSYPADEVAPPYQTVEPELFYVTDRQADDKTSQGHYAAGRSASMAFGSVTVRFGEDMAWSDLVSVSNQNTR